MKSLLIVPKESWFTKGTLNMPPGGITYIAAVLEENNYEVELLDAFTERLSLNKLKERIKKSNPDIVGVTFTTETRFSGFETIELAKKTLPNATTVAGGPHVSLTTEDTLTHIPELDVVVRGEGEMTFLDLVKTLEAGEDLVGVKGISYRENGNIRDNPQREYIKDLDALPYPARHLLPIEKYDTFVDVSGKGKKRMMNIISSRGCPNHCYFCAACLLSGRTWRARTPENVVGEIEHVIDKYGVEGIWFWDDTFNLSNSRAKEICDLIIERDLDISWFADIRADTADRELIRKMAASGCYMAAFGVETGSQDVLDNLVKKRIELEKVKELKRWCQEEGVIGKGMFIISHPEETFEQAKKSIEFMREIGGLNSINILKIYPGTEVEEMAKEKGILPKDFTWTKPFDQGINLMNTIVGDVPIFVDKMKIEEIAQLLFMWADLRKEPLHDRLFSAIRGIRSPKDLITLLTMGNGYLKYKMTSLGHPLFSEDRNQPKKE